jgi:hypothetical protein
MADGHHMETAVDNGAEELVAVVAHVLLESVSSIQLSAATVRDRWDRLDDAARIELLELIVARSAHLADVVTDLARTGGCNLLGSAPVAA